MSEFVFFKEAIGIPQRNNHRIVVYPQTPKGNLMSSAVITNPVNGPATGPKARPTIHPQTPKLRNPSIIVVSDSSDRASNYGSLQISVIVERTLFYLPSPSIVFPNKLMHTEFFVGTNRHSPASAQNASRF